MRFKANSVFTLIILSAFIVMGFLLITHHEMWHDETCEWLVAKNSRSYAELLTNFSLMRHTAAWVSILWLLSKFTANMFSMQLLNLLFASLAVFIFVRYSSFPRIIKGLFPFGYLTLYEYGTISRDYALGMALLFIFAALYKKQNKNFLLMSLILALCASANIFSLLFVIIVCPFLFFEAITFIKKNKHSPTIKIILLNYIIGFLFIFSAIFLSIIISRPFTASGNIHNASYSTAFANTIRGTNPLVAIYALFKMLGRIFSSSFLHIPLPILQFFWTDLYIYPINWILGIIVLFFSLALFRKRGRYFVLWLVFALVFYSLSLLLIETFTWRHYGYLFLYFLVCLWIAYPEEKNKQMAYFNTNIANLLAKKVLVYILIMQISGAAIAAYFDWFYPFTNAVKVSDFIRANRLENKTFVGWRDDFIPSIVAYGNLKEVYYPQGERFGSFVIFDKKREEIFSFDKFFKPVFTLNKKPEDLIFIFTVELLPKSQADFLENVSLAIGPDKYRFKRIALFYPAIVIGESFALFRLEKTI